MDDKVLNNFPFGKRKWIVFTIKGHNIYSMHKVKYFYIQSHYPLQRDQGCVINMHFILSKRPLETIVPLLCLLLTIKAYIFMIYVLYMYSRLLDID